MRDNDYDLATLRETDRWVRRALIYVPILSFAFGWGSGVITSYVMFQDHEKRLSYVEGRISIITERQEKVLGVLENHYRVNLH